MDEINEMRQIMHISNPQERDKALLELAEQDCIAAQKIVGKCYYEGSGGFSKDIKKADRYFRRAADQREEYSQFMVWSIASEYCTTIFDEHSYEFKNLEKSAESGYPSAVLLICWAYTFGGFKDWSGYSKWSIKKSRSKALHFFEKLDEE